MKIHEIDNSLKDLGKTVLWQYDKAVRLLSVMKHMQMLYHCAVEQFWRYWTEKVLSIDTCGAFGCSIWGSFLGVPHPTVVGSDGDRRLIATSVYRRVLKGAFFLMKANSSFTDILGYLEIVFGVGGEDSLSKWTATVSEYGWTTNVDELNDVYKAGVAYAKGDIFSFDKTGEGVLRNWKCTRDVSADENTSFDAIAGLIEATNEPTNGVGDGETLLLKLYSPEGVCRKIGGAPNNSLTISTEYKFGETTIKAVATRRRKCGLSLVDKQDLSLEYGKSPFYDEMHPDQKALFEQRFDEFCPTPLGIKTNEPLPEVVFGFIGQENEQYEAGRTYRKGDSFGRISEDGGQYVYECMEDVDSVKNTSFSAIENVVMKTNGADPFIGGLVDSIPPYDRMPLLEVGSGIFLPFKKDREAFLSIFPDAEISGGIRFWVATETGESLEEGWGCRCQVIPIKYGGLFSGAYNGMTSVYHFDQSIARPFAMRHTTITDGETFCANINLRAVTIYTKKLHDVLNGTVNGGHLFTKTMGDKRPVQILSLGPNWLSRLGVTDAIGYIANELGFRKIPYQTSMTPVDGITYPDTTEFMIGGKPMVQLNGGEYREKGNTTIISSTTLEKLG